MHRIGAAERQFADSGEFDAKRQRVDAHREPQNVQFQSFPNTGQNTKITTER